MNYCFYKMQPCGQGKGNTTSLQTTSDLLTLKQPMDLHFFLFHIDTRNIIERSNKTATNIKTTKYVIRPPIICIKVLT